MNPTEPGPARPAELPADIEERAHAILLGPAHVLDEQYAALCAAHAPFRSQLETLRTDFARAARLLDPPAGPAPGLPAPLGPYRFERRIGEGAFGAVFLATQEQPIRRQVAIKLLHHATHSQHTVARFHTERETLARMNHPAIARIFDAGMDPGGRPYFVMEYVPGEPLHQYVARHDLDLVARLRLFLAACEGVSHAHQRGVIHRDLKPHNILVAEVDGRPMPKVIDFGLAKVLDDEPAALVRTHAGAVLGTPAYMSPEQLRGDAHDVDTRTDVYSLGVILFELLTGTLPMAPERYRSTTLAELQRLLLEADAPLASVRAASTSPALASRLRGDLDWILRKAMARHRDERYSSVEELAADLGRHLAHEPVYAGPPSVTYVLRKFVRRHRVAVAAAVAVLTTLIAGLVVSTRLYQEARDHASAAQRNLADFGRLADVLELEELEALARDLWPSAPERLTEHEAWLRRAQGLLARRAEHAQTVTQLETRVAVQAADATAGPRGDRFLLDRLRKLLTGLERLTGDGGLHQQMERRTGFARTVLQRTVTDMAAAWERAGAAVRDSRRYGGRTLQPIPGLVPLGPDPKSGLEEFALLQSGTVPARGADGRLVLGDDTAIVLVLVPGGNVRLGSQSTDPNAPNYDPHRTPFEIPVERTRVAPFLIGKYELTQGQVRTLGVPPGSLCRAGQVRAREGLITLRHPEESVLGPVVEAWLPHFGLRLPGLAEWELAARAGGSTIWVAGNEPSSLQGHANVADATFGAETDVIKPWDGSVRDGFAGPAPVGSFLPNAFGLHDVLGNVAELVVGQARWKPGVSYLARGGSFMLRPIESRIGSTRLVPPEQSTPELGVRVARSLPDP